MEAKAVAFLPQSSLPSDRLSQEVGEALSGTWFHALLTTRKDHDYFNPCFIDKGLGRASLPGGPLAFAGWQTSLDLEI